MYRTIDASFWTDRKIRQLNPNERLLFLYLITNPHTHVSGLYYLPDLIAQHETGLSEKQFGYGIDTLFRLGLCRFDRENELVFVVRMFRFQGKGQKNTLSAAHHLSKDVHNSFLIKEFLETYPEVGKHVENTLWDRVSKFGPPENGFLIPENGLQRTELSPTPSVNPDVAYAHFAEAHAACLSVPYQHKKADFIQLAKLRKTLGVESREIPESWAESISNYFASPLASWTLADLCVRFAVFRNSPLDRYGKPTNHQGAKRETNADKNDRAIREFLHRDVDASIR